MDWTYSIWKHTWHALTWKVVRVQRSLHCCLGRCLHLYHDKDLYGSLHSSSHTVFPRDLILLLDSFISKCFLCWFFFVSLHKILVFNFVRHLESLKWEGLLYKSDGWMDGWLTEWMRSSSLYPHEEVIEIYVLYLRFSSLPLLAENRLPEK